MFNAGDTIRRRRLQRRWSLDHLANRVGVHSSTISRIERGHSIPGLKLLTDIVRELGLSPRRFIREAIKAGLRGPEQP